MVLGPGLGRSDDILKNARDIVEQVKAKRIPLVVDAVSWQLVTVDKGVFILKKLPYFKAYR